MSEWFLWSCCVNDGVCFRFYRKESSSRGHCWHLPPQWGFETWVARDKGWWLHIDLWCKEYIYVELTESYNQREFVLKPVYNNTEVIQILLLYSVYIFCLAGKKYSRLKVVTFLIWTSPCDAVTLTIWQIIHSKVNCWSISKHWPHSCFFRVFQMQLYRCDYKYRQAAKHECDHLVYLKGTFRESLRKLTHSKSPLCLSHTVFYT